MTLFGNVAFADVMKMRSCWGRVGHKCNVPGVCAGRGTRDTGTWREADGEGGVDQPRIASICRGWETPGVGPPKEPPEGTITTGLDGGLLASTTARERASKPPSARELVTAGPTLHTSMGLPAELRAPEGALSVPPWAPRRAQKGSPA